MTTAVVGLVLLGLGWAPRALAMPIAPERGQGTVYLSAAQLRREAAADRAQHLRWAAGNRAATLGAARSAAVEEAASRLQHLIAEDR